MPAGVLDARYITAHPVQRQHEISHTGFVHWSSGTCWDAPQRAYICVPMWRGPVETAQDIAAGMPGR
jgi:hypothetical protein